MRRPVCTGSVAKRLLLHYTPIGVCVKKNKVGNWTQSPKLKWTKAPEFNDWHRCRGEVISPTMRPNAMHCGRKNSAPTISISSIAAIMDVDAASGRLQAKRAERLSLRPSAWLILMFNRTPVRAPTPRLRRSARARLPLPPPAQLLARLPLPARLARRVRCCHDHPRLRGAGSGPYAGAACPS